MHIARTPHTRILVLENTHTKYPHSPFLENTFAMTTVGDSDIWWWWWRWWLWWLIMKKLILQPNLATHRICAGLLKGQRWEIPDFTFIRYQFHFHSLQNHWNISPQKIMSGNICPLFNFLLRKSTIQPWSRKNWFYKRWRQDTDRKRNRYFVNGLFITLTFSSLV